VERIKIWCKKRGFDLDKKSYDEKITLIKNNKNLGYAGGNNIGIKYAMKDSYFKYFWLLNNDTVVDKKSLGKLVNVAENRKRAGILGSKNLDYGDRSTVQNIADQKLIWPNFVKRENISKNEKIHEVKWVSGASLFIRNKVVREIGLLDEKFFVYGEEKEWCVRAKKVIGKYIKF